MKVLVHLLDLNLISYWFYSHDNTPLSNLDIKSKKIAMFLTPILVFQQYKNITLDSGTNQSVIRYNNVILLTYSG
jgi:hypothetical protein